jgi:hypothetical protein
LGIPIEFPGFGTQADNLALQSDQINKAQIIIGLENKSLKSGI